MPVLRPAVSVAPRLDRAVVSVVLLFLSGAASSEEGPENPYPTTLTVRLEEAPEEACKALHALGEPEAESEARNCGIRYRFAPSNPLAPATPAEAEWQRLEARVRVQLLQDLALGWTDPASPVFTTLIEPYGYTELPPIDDLFQTSCPTPTRRGEPVAPTATGECAPGDRKQTIQTRATARTTVDAETFRGLNTAPSDPSMVLLDGRFDRAPDPNPLLPFSKVLPDEIASSWWSCSAGSPLHEGPGDEVAGDARPTRLAPDGPDALACAADLASAHSREFFDQLGRDIVRFGTPAYTHQHLRALASMVAMSAPPGHYRDLEPIELDDLVAASLGQLDEPDFRPDPSVPPTGEFLLDYQALPETIAWAALDSRRTTVGLVDLIPVDAKCLFGDLVQESVEAPSSLERSVIAEWARHAATADRQGDLLAVFPGRILEWMTRGTVAGCWSEDPEVKPTAIPAIPELARSQEERQLMVEHLRYQIYGLLDVEEPVARQQLHRAVDGAWQEVLAVHGVVPEAMGQVDPFTVDPLSVCATSDGEDALRDEVDQAIDVDVLFALAEPGGALPTNPAWEGRAQLPFVFVDDPRAAGQAEVTRVLDLPGEAGLYRARWRLWAGWHLLWDVEAIPPVSTSEDRDITRELQLRTAAFCSDITLVAAPVLPTLVRAAVLPEGALGSISKATDPELARSLPWWIRNALLASTPPDEAAILFASQRDAEPLHGAGIERPFATARGAIDTVDVQVSGWAMALPVDPEVEVSVLAPDRIWIPQDGDSEGLWRHRNKHEIVLDLGVGAGSSLVPQPVGAVDMHVQWNGWIANSPRAALQLGAGWRVPGTQPTQALATTPVLRAEVVAGIRFAPLPGPLQRKAVREAAWGTTNPAGKRVVGQTQFGVRVAAVVGAKVPSPAWVEPWGAVAVHRRLAPRGSLNPTHPGWLIGPFARVGVDPFVDADASVDPELFLIGGIRTWHLIFSGKLRRQPS